MLKCVSVGFWVVAFLPEYVIKQDGMLSGADTQTLVLSKNVRNTPSNVKLTVNFNKHKQRTRF